MHVRDNGYSESFCDQTCDHHVLFNLHDIFRKAACFYKEFVDNVPEAAPLVKENVLIGKSVM